jgi:hypothetical protein
MGGFIARSVDMADNRAQEDQITAKLLILSNQQVKALQDATFLGWREGELEAYQKRGDRVSLLRQQPNELAVKGLMRPSTL